MKGVSGLAGVYITPEPQHEFCYAAHPSPLRQKSSNEINFDDHNLWMLDERLAYHRYLASDKRFVEHDGPIDVAGNQRPDIIIYNNPFALTPGEPAMQQPVIIVEFKRPERQDVSGDHDPVKQVLDYIERIRQGKAKRPAGTTIERPADNLPFYCYVVMTLNEAARRGALRNDFKPTPDGRGYFRFHDFYNAYIEVSSYEKVLDDAIKRNQAFFDRLEIKVRR